MNVLIGNGRTMDERRRTVRILDLLRKKDLHPEVGVPKSTVADWIEDFNVYIPKVKQGSVIYYKPETIDVLKFIKQCRDQNYNKPQIMQLLSEKGFSVTVEEAVEDVKSVLKGEGSPRDNLFAVMQTTAQAVVEIAEQKQSIRALEEKQDEQDELLQSLSNQQNEQDGRMDEIEKRTYEIDLIKERFEVMQKQLAITNEKLQRTEKELLEVKQKKSFLSRLFGK